MCGIAGVAFDDPNRAADGAVLRSMAAAIVHRGPDSDGFHVAPGVGLAFRRLSIIDLETGAQPLFSEDGRIALVCNGEIYNYRQMRRDLQRRGHHFSTNSDAEVIVHLYQEHGSDCLEQLRGMFAFALWDGRRRRLMLARDRFGIKPLYYACGEGGLYFGSEQKAILASEAVSRRMDVCGLRDLFQFGFVATRRTLFRAIRRLAPAHCLLFEEGRTSIRRYWTPDFPDADEQAADRRPAAEWAEGLRSVLSESVRLHLQSDVGAGAYLSPGIDSSSVVSLMGQVAEGRPETYTLVFEDASVNEAGQAATLDGFPGYDIVNHRVVCRRRDFELLPQATWHNEGMGSGSLDIPGLLLARQAGREHKVILSGEGADEILGGYEWYRTDKLLAPLSGLPAGVRGLPSRLPPAARRWPGACRILAGPGNLAPARYRALIGSATSMADGAALLSQGVRSEPEFAAESYNDISVPERFNRWHRHNQLAWFDQTIRLPCAIVRQLDSNSMAHSVEVRVPFLDHVVAGFAARIPPRLKLKGLIEKHILRQAMRDDLPPAVRKRRKYPLQAPLEDWLSFGNLPEFAHEELQASRLQGTGLFDAEHVRQMLAEHRLGRGAHSRRLLAVINAQIWHRLFRASGP